MPVRVKEGVVTWCDWWDWDCVSSAVVEIRLREDVEGGGRLEVTQTEIGHYKSDCLASDVGPLASAKV